MLVTHALASCWTSTWDTTNVQWRRWRWRLRRRRRTQKTDCCCRDKEKCLVWNVLCVHITLRLMALLFSLSFSFSHEWTFRQHTASHSVRVVALHVWIFDNIMSPYHVRRLNSSLCIIFSARRHVEDIWFFFLLHYLYKFVAWNISDDSMNWFVCFCFCWKQKKLYTVSPHKCKFHMTYKANAKFHWIMWHNIWMSNQWHNL